MEIFSNILGVALSIILIWLIWYSNTTLRTRYAEDIRVVWYFYSLTLVISHIIAFWATANGAIDSNGSFQGDAGRYVSTLISTTLDINLSFIILGVILSIIILPQFLNYIFSGIFGVASKPIYLNESLSFLMWGIIKTFIVTAGVTATIVIFGTSLSWESFEFNKAFGWLLVSVGFNSFAFFTLVIFREARVVLNDIKDALPEKLINKFFIIHSWFTRHTNQKEVLDKSLPNKRMNRDSP